MNVRLMVILMHMNYLFYYVSDYDDHGNYERIATVEGEIGPDNVRRKNQ